MVELRAATHKDILELYGGRHKHSMKAIVACIDGVPKGIAGLYFDGDKLIAFSEMKEELRAYPFLIYKAARKVLSMVEKSGVPVYAIASPKIDTAEPLLIHLGFTHVGTCNSGEVYQWNPE